MAFANIPLTKADFEQSGWQKIIEDCEEKECLAYSRLFFAKAREGEAGGDQKRQELFTLLGAITSFMLKSDSKDEPFGPLAVFRNSRSAILDDLQDLHLDALKEIVADIKDPEMRARIADVLWVTRRDFRMAELAVEAYLESAKNLENPENWPKCVDRIERATRIAVSLGSRNVSSSLVFSHIEGVLDTYRGEDALFLSAKMMELLLEFGQGDPTKYATLSAKAASRAETESNWHRARTYWEIEARWHQKQTDPEKRREALVNAAETYFKEGEAALKRSPPSFMVASIRIQRAIEAYRRAGGGKTRIEELQKILLEYQAKSMDEMKPLSGSVEISEELRKAIDQAVSKVKNKTFEEAILELGRMCSPPRMDYLRQQAEKSAKEHPLQHLFSTMALDSHGKVVGRKPSMLSGDPKELEEATRAEMFRQAEVHDTVDVQCILEPVRQQIILDHRCRVGDFFPIVSNNPLIPEGREYLYAQGLQAGLVGDLPVAAHLIIPQFEHSVRYVLAQRGIITSSIDAEGIQKDYDLNSTLYLPVLKEILGENTVFHLQHLLVEKLGANLRNKMAHGLMSQGEFYSVQAAYLWWLILKVVCIPIISSLRREEGKAEGIDSPEAQKVDTTRTTQALDKNNPSHKDKPES